MTRRELLRWAGAATTTGLPGLGCSSPGAAPVRGPSPTASYFSAEDTAVLEALADAILPPDDRPGGSRLGVVGYVEQLLTAFDVDPPRIFAGGPYSGRTAFASATGGPSDRFPEDSFMDFLPLDRYQTKAWKLRIFGSKGVPGGGPNDAVTGPVVGLRDAVATAISDARAAMPKGTSVPSLRQDEKITMLRALDAGTQDTLVELVMEAAFAPPEYGGNPDASGWVMTHFEGDAQPLGYSWFDTRTGAYWEDPEHPVSKPNPGKDPEPLDATTEQTIATVVTFLGGKVFP